MATKYEVETHSVRPDGSIDIEGRIVEVLSYKAHTRRLTVLVEKDAGGDDGPVTLADIADAEGVDDTDQKLRFFCNAPLGSGGRCSREVDEMGERCWQHQDEEEAEER